MRFDGSLHGRFEGVGQIADVYGDFADRGVFAKSCVDMDGVSHVADTGNDIHFLSNHVDYHDADGIYRHSSVVKADFERE